jgi:hypothetical protein
VEAPTSHNPMGLHGLLLYLNFQQGEFYLIIIIIIMRKRRI